MADLYYYEEGYIDAKYHVYVADAEIALGPYIEDGYIDAGYYLDYSAIGTLTCDADVVTGVTVEASGTWTSAATLSAVIGRLQSAQADFTGAFSPTLTVDAFKNHTAIIESTTTFTVDAQANRSANVLLEHIANLNAQAAKTAVIDSTMATQATLSAQANHSVVSSATLTSTATFSCLAFNVQFGASTLNSTTSIFTSRYFGTGRPRTGTVDASAYYDATTKYEGTHSIARSSLGSIYTSDQYDQFRPKANQAFNFSTYVWVDEGPGPDNTSNAKILAGIGQLTNQNPNSRDATEDMWYVSMLARKLSVSWNIGGTWYTGSANSGNIDLNGTAGWVNINFYRSANDTVVYYSASGSPVVGGSATRSRSLAGQNGALTQPATASNRKLKLFGVDNSYFIGADPITRFDDLSYSVNDVNQIVLKFNNNSNDSLEVITHEGAAAFASTASLTAIGTNAKGAASAALTSTATLLANAGILQSAGAGLESTVTQNTDAVKTVQALADISSSASVSATAFRIKEFISNQNALFTPAISVQAQLAGVALLESSFAQSTSAVKTTDVTATITSTATVTAASTVTAGLAADLASTATVTVTGTRTQTFTADLASESTLACEFTAFNNVSAAFTSEVTITADVERYRSSSSTLSTAVTLSADVERFRLTSSTVNTTATVAATATRIQSADSALSSVVTQSTVAVKTPGIGVSITATVTITATPIYTAEAIATVGALFTPSMDADAQFAGVALLEATSSLAAVIGVIKQFSITGSALGLAVTSSEPYIGNLSGLPFFGLKVREPQFTASIWARRLSVTGTPQPLWSSYDATFGGDTAGALILNGNDVILRFNYDPDEPNAEWTDLAPTDSDWHHYLIRSTVNASFPVNNWQLWIDGVYQGVSSSYFAAGQIEFSNGGRALIGNGQIANLTPGYDITSRRLNGDVLQLWMGLTTDSQFNPGLFYDGGYQDLGSTGTLGGLLPTPKIYHRLESPFTGITQAQGSGSLALNYDTVVARATTLITANAVSLAIINPTVVTTLTAAITYQVSPTIAAASASTITCQITQFTGIIANVTSTATLSCDETKINGGNAALTVAADIQAVAGFFENFTSDLASTVTLECDFDNIPPTRGEAALTAQFTVTVDAQSFTDSITLMMSMGTITCDATLIPPIRAQADLVTTATLTATIGSIEQFAALVMSAGTMTITASKTTGIIQTVSAVSTLACEIKHYKGIILTVTAFNTQLTVGDVINIDPYLTLTIPAESRALRILPENREITIESETRVNII